MVLYEYVLPFNSPDWALWFIMLISCAMGIGLGFVVARYQAAGFILLGVWLGASFTFIFESLIIRILVAAFLVYKVWNKKRKFGIVLAAGLVIIPSIYSFFPNTVSPQKLDGNVVHNLGVADRHERSVRRNLVRP